MRSVVSSSRGAPRSQDSAPRSKKQHRGYAPFRVGGNPIKTTKVWTAEGLKDDNNTEQDGVGSDQADGELHTAGGSRKGQRNSSEGELNPPTSVGPQPLSCLVMVCALVCASGEERSFVRYGSDPAGGECIDGNLCLLVNALFPGAFL